MSYRLVVRPEVDDDLLEAETWYEKRQVGLGKEFYDNLLVTIANLPNHPLIYRVRFPRLQVRWVLSDRFPYRVIFRVEEDMVIIYAVLHAARHDRHWKRRM